MKISVAQTRPIVGDIIGNCINHQRLIALAVSQRSDVIIFPELSLTGYEPKLAHSLATHPDDSRFDVFQKLSDENQITIGVGIPLNMNPGVCISMIIFQPRHDRRLYSKRYLHPDEDPFFVIGENFPTLLINKIQIGLAICYELSVLNHAELAAKHGAAIYIASVAKTVEGISKALVRLSEIARQYAIPVMMSNCIGDSDGEEYAGKSSIWNDQGELLAQLDDKSEGILIFDTSTLITTQHQ